jgi:hypothetical protein
MPPATPGGGPPVPIQTWQAVLDRAEPNDIVEVAWQASFAGQYRPDLARLRQGHTGEGTHGGVAIAYCLGEAGHEEEALTELEAIVAAAHDDRAVAPADAGEPAAARDVVYRAVDKAVESYGTVHLRTQPARCDAASPPQPQTDPQPQPAVLYSSRLSPTDQQAPTNTTIPQTDERTVP